MDQSQKALIDKKYPLLDMMGIGHHLWAERHCEHFRYSSVVVSREEKIATFLIYEMTGKLIGYQRYNPYGVKDKRNDGEGKYYTYTNGFGVWGLESLELGRPLVFVEGVFDACILHKLGYSAIAILTHTPPRWFVEFVLKVLIYRHPTMVHLKDGDGYGKMRGIEHVLQCPTGEDPNSMGYAMLSEFMKDHGIIPATPQLNMMRVR